MNEYECPACGNIEDFYIKALVHTELRLDFIDSRNGNWELQNPYADIVNNGVEKIEEFWCGCGQRIYEDDIDPKKREAKAFADMKAVFADIQELTADSD